MTRRILIVLFVISVASLWVPATHAQDVTITNLSQLVEQAFSANHSLYLPWTPWEWRAYPLDNGEPWWVDCSQVSCADLLSTSTNPCATLQMHGVTVTCVVLTKNVLTGETLLQSGCSTDTIAVVEAPNDYQPGTQLGENAWVWRQWQQITNCLDCWDLTTGEIPPPIVTLKTRLADAMDYATWSNAQAEAQAEAEASSVSSFAVGGFAALAEDDSGDSLSPDSVSCIVTDPASPFYVISIQRDTNKVTTLSWQSCTNYIYGVLSADQLNPSTVYTGRTAMWGQANSTSWSDTSTTNINFRFYKIVRMDPNGDFDGDGLPNWWELQYGMNLFNPSDATNDFDADGYSNFDEYLMGTGAISSNLPTTVYVDSMNTNGVWDGTQAHPFRYIQDAIECSVPVTSNLAIRVRPGNYYETVSNQHYDFNGNVLTNRSLVYIYAANTNWSLSTDPETHIIDSSGLPNGDTLGNPGATLAPAVEFFDVARARINGFTIRGGKGFYGGGILAYSSTGGPIYISNCIIEKNGGGGGEAGGIFIQAGTNSLIYNTVVAKNSGLVGGIIDIFGSRIWNCTVVSNQSTQSSVGGIAGNPGVPNVRNCAVWGNAFDLYYVDVDYSSFGTYSSIAAGAHNLSVDPIFVTTAFGNYRLQTNSPVRGGGTSLPIEQRDLYGNSRPATGSFDIGSNQYKDTDGDGMQDDWEVKHGLNPASGTDGTGNTDGDGFNNLQEYNHNTDPNNADTDGDGINDNLDPDPTTPDEVLTIEFHSFYRDAVWQYYINGQTDPTWLNQPPTQPRVIKLKNYHIGDALSLQMRYLSGPLDPLLFLVPLQSVGAFSVLPAVNATPVLHFTDSAPLGQLTPPSGWTTTVWRATITNDGPCAGLDDITNDLKGGGLWLSAPNGGTNTITVIIQPTMVVSQVFFKSALGTFNVIPSQASSSTQLVQIISLSTNTLPAVDQLFIQGYGAQNSYTTTAAFVNIDLMPSKSATVAVYRVTASTMTTTPPTNVPTASQLKTYLDSVIGKQANVSLTVLTVTNITVNYDLNHDGKLLVSDDAEVLSPEQSNIVNYASTPNAINIYYVNSLYDPTDPNVEGDTYSNRIAFIQDSHSDSSVHISAHEIGHALGLADVYDDTKRASERLMHFVETAENPCRLIRDEWDTANKTAR